MVKYSQMGFLILITGMHRTYVYDAFGTAMHKYENLQHFFTYP